MDGGRRHLGGAVHVDQRPRVPLGGVEGGVQRAAREPDEGEHDQRDGSRNVLDAPSRERRPRRLRRRSAAPLATASRLTGLPPLRRRADRRPGDRRAGRRRIGKDGRAGSAGWGRPTRSAAQRPTASTMPSPHEAKRRVVVIVDTVHDVSGAPRGGVQLLVCSQPGRPAHPAHGTGHGHRRPDGVSCAERVIHGPPGGAHGARTMGGLLLKCRRPMDPKHEQNLKPAEIVSLVKSHGRAGFSRAVGAPLLLVRLDDPSGDLALMLEAALEAAPTTDGWRPEVTMGYETVIGSVEDTMQDLEPAGGEDADGVRRRRAPAGCSSAPSHFAVPLHEAQGGGQHLLRQDHRGPRAHQRRGAAPLQRLQVPGLVRVRRGRPLLRVRRQEHQPHLPQRGAGLPVVARRRHARRHAALRRRRRRLLHGRAPVGRADGRPASVEPRAPPLTGKRKKLPPQTPCPLLHVRVS